MEFSKYTLEVLIHDLVLTKNLTILVPKISLSIGNLARLLVEAHNSIGFQNNVRPFSHGKKLLINLPAG